MNYQVITEITDHTKMNYRLKVPWNEDAQTLNRVSPFPAMRAKWLVLNHVIETNYRLR